MLEEQLQAGLRLPPSSTGLHLAQIGDALGFEIGLEHIAVCRVIQLNQHRGIRDRRPPVTTRPPTSRTSSPSRPR